MIATVLRLVPIEYFVLPQTPGCIYLVMELCEGGDLATYIERSGGRVEESVARNFMRQIGN